MAASFTTTLTSKDIPAVRSANKLFGTDNSLLVVRPGRECCNYFHFTIPEGFYALVTRHGADVDYEDGSPIWPPGLHLGPPWLKVSHLVTMQSIVLQTPIKGCKTKDNVTVTIDMALVLRVMADKNRPGDDPKNVRKFVHMVTAMGLQQQLQDAQAEAVRTLARCVTHTEVFGLRNVRSQELQDLSTRLNISSDTTPEVPSSKLESNMTTRDKDDSAIDDRIDTQEEKDLIGDHDQDDELEAVFSVEHGAKVTKVMKDRLNKQFKAQGVEIMDVIIENITLPQEIQTQMSQKTMVISQNAEQRMQQKHDLLVLEQNEALITLKQSHQEQKLELLEDGRQKATLMQLELDKERAIGSASLEEIITQMSVDVSMVESDSDIKVQRIRDLTQLEAQRIELEAEYKATRIFTEISSETQDTLAKADLKCAQIQAVGEKTVFEAEGTIAPQMRTYNDYYTNMQKIGVHKSLAKNNELVVTGISGGEAANRLVLADAALRNETKNGKHEKESMAERSRILSELAVAGGNAQVRINVGGSEERVKY